MNAAGQTALMEAAARGDISYCRALLDAGADPNVRNREHETALSFAIVWGQPPVVRLLLRRGARPENPSKPWTPLMYAAREGDHVSAQLLLRAGAKPHRADAHGRTAWDIAREARRSAFLRQFGLTTKKS